MLTDEYLIENNTRWRCVCLGGGGGGVCVGVRVRVCVHIKTFKKIRRQILTTTGPLVTAWQQRHTVYSLLTLHNNCSNTVFLVDMEVLESVSLCWSRSNLLQ